MTLNGERLRNVRRYKKMTMDNLSSEMSRKLDISATKSMISQWENNKVTPREDTIEKLSLLFEVPEDYLVGSNKFGFAIMDLRFRTGLSIEEFSKKTEHSVDYLDFIEKNHVLKKMVDLFNFGTFVEDHNVIKYFNELYGINIIPSLEVIKDQLIYSNESIKNINSKSEDLSLEEYKEFLRQKIHQADKEVNFRYQESKYFNNLERDMDWWDKTFKTFIVMNGNKPQVNQSIDLNELTQKSIEVRYNNKIISNENRKKILGMLEILLGENK